MKENRLKRLYVQELKDIYSAENQIIKALPKMARATKNRRLATAFNHHLGQTRNQAKRLKKILKSHKESTRAPKCKGMQGLLKEGDSVIKEAKKDVRDAGLIAAAQRVEHYEMAGYGTTRTLATRLGESEAADSLQATLDEEEEADRKLTAIAESEVNPEAAASSRKAR